MKNEKFVKIYNFYSRTIETCSLYCLQNANTCNAFEFLNETCSVSNSPTFIKYSKYTKQNTIWIDPSKTSVTLNTSKENYFITLYMKI